MQRNPYSFPLTRPTFAVNTVRGISVSESRDALRLPRIGEVVDHDRAVRVLRGHYEERSVVADLDVTEGGRAVHLHRIDEPGRRRGNVPDIEYARDRRRGG